MPEDSREYPQTPKQMPRDLRDSRKRQSKCRGTCGTPRKRKSKSRESCGTPANAQANAGRLAGVPQTPKSSSKHLQQCCRHFQKRFGRASVETLCWHYSYTELTLYSVFLRHTCPVKRQLPVRTESLTGSISNDNVRAEKLSAVEILLHQRQHFLGLAFEIGTECLVLVATQIG